MNNQSVNLVTDITIFNQNLGKPEMSKFMWNYRLLQLSF